MALEQSKPRLKDKMECIYAGCDYPRKRCIGACPAWPGPDDTTRARVADIISTNPLIQSLLYDIDLLPEQIRDKRRYGYMLAVIDHMLVYLSRATAQQEADQRDAARYRWLRERLVPTDYGPLHLISKGERVDAAIDAAMSAQDDIEESK